MEECVDPYNNNRKICGILIDSYLNKQKLILSANIYSKISQTFFFLQGLVTYTLSSVLRLITFLQINLAILYDILFCFHFFFLLFKVSGFFLIGFLIGLKLIK